MNHPYIGLHGRFNAFSSDVYPQLSHGVILGVVAAVDAEHRTVTLLCDDGTHAEKCMAALILDDPNEARRRLVEVAS